MSEGLNRGLLPINKLPSSYLCFLYPYSSSTYLERNQYKACKIQQKIL